MVVRVEKRTKNKCWGTSPRGGVCHLAAYYRQGAIKGEASKNIRSGVLERIPVLMIR